MCVTTEANFSKMLEMNLWGVEERYKKIITQVREGDELYVHRTKISCGATFLVTKTMFFDETPVWSDGSYPYRLKIKPKYVPSAKVSDKEVIKRLGISVRQSMCKLSSEHFKVLEENLRAAGKR